LRVTAIKTVMAGAPSSLERALEQRGANASMAVWVAEIVTVMIED
jgi:hypothetical protein